MEIKGKELLDLVELQAVQEGDTVTIKPKDKAFPAPGDIFYWVSVTISGTNVYSDYWYSAEWAKEYLKRGLIWQTEEEANDAAKRMDAALAPVLEELKKGGKNDDGN